MLTTMNLKQFGGKITTALEEQYASSGQWHNGHFHNIELTGMNIRLKDVPGLLYKQFTSKDRRPGQAPELRPFDLAAFLKDTAEARFIWYGHSAVLLRMNGKNIFVDPMLGSDASPIAPFKTRRFSGGTLEIIDDLPFIDLVLLTHDHYDHLDMDSILKLKNKTARYFVALGVKRHLVAWGIDPGMVTEFDWWDKTEFSGIEITFTPSRHFSGRGLRDRFKSLWGGWALKTANESVYFSGDGGYGSHFREIGERLGPFNLAFMECGQYNELWRQIHMMPEESVLAAMEVHSRKSVPVHWGAFTLAMHAWDEPAKRFASEADRLGLEAVYPQLGGVYGISSFQADRWWEEIRDPKLDI